MPRMSHPEVVKGERKSKSFGQRDMDMPSTGIRLMRHLACRLNHLLVGGLVDIRTVAKMAGCAGCIRESLEAPLIRFAAVLAT